MPEVIIKYKKPETLKVLEDLSKSLDFDITLLDTGSAEEKELFDDILVPADKNADLSALNQVFNGKNLDARKLREEAWRRAK